MDPFLGSGTTMLAAMCACRNSMGYEIDPKLQSVLLEKIASIPDIARFLIEDRLAAHHEFIKERTVSKGDLKYENRHYGFAVMTRQEQDLVLDRIQNIQYLSGNRFTVGYEDNAADPFTDQLTAQESTNSGEAPARPTKGRQLKLF